MPCVIVTAKVRTMKGVGVLESFHVSAKLRDRAMHDEMLVICVTAKSGTMTSAVASGFVTCSCYVAGGVCTMYVLAPHCFDSI